MVSQGIDPKALDNERQAINQQATEEEKREKLKRQHSLSWFFEQHTKDPAGNAKWKIGAKTAIKKASCFYKYVCPTLGEMPISEITGVHIKSLGDTKEFQKAKHGTRKKVKAVLSGIFAYAEGKGWLPEGVNPLNTSAARDLFAAPKGYAPIRLN